MNGSQREAPRLVSVIMPMLNSAATLPLQLGALSRQTYSGDWEIVVADNGSTDDSLAIAAEWADRLPHMEVVDASASRGASHARNAAVAASSGDLILCCDADDIVFDDWVEALVTAAADGDVIGGGHELRLLNDPANKPWQPNLDTWISDGPAHSFLPFAVSSSCGIWRDVLEALGGWDEHLWPSEDVDLSWRAQMKSYTLVFTEKALVHYRMRPTLSGYFKQHYERARSRAHLFAMYRHDGMPGTNTRIAAFTWMSLVYRLPFALFSLRWRLIWVNRAAYATGHLVGSLRNRVVYL